MTEKDLADTILDFQARLIAHEDIMRALVLRLATENTADNVERLQWVKELHQSLTKNRLGVMGLAGYKPEYMELDKAVTKHTDLFFKPFR